MQSEFNKWLTELSELAERKNIVIEAKYYDGLQYFFEGEKLTPEAALPRYINMVERTVAIRSEQISKSITKDIGIPVTVGQLRQMIFKYRDETRFGFRNQPIQKLVDVKNDGKEPYLVFDRI